LSTRPDIYWWNRGERGREWRVQFTPVKANWLAPVFVPFPQRIPPATGPAPVEARFGNYAPASRHRIRPPTGPAPVEARFGNYAPASRHRIPPATGAGSLLCQREEGKNGGRGARYSFQTGLPPVQDRWGAKYKRGGRGKKWGVGCAYSYQTGLPPVQDRWGPEGGERGIQGNQSRNGNGYARKREIRPECDKLNTPGRESFSEVACTTRFVVARKRPPTPLRPQTPTIQFSQFDERNVPCTDCSLPCCWPSSLFRK